MIQLKDIRLCTSEAFLVFMPINRFKVGATPIVDKLERFAIDLFTASLTSLLQNKYLEIVHEKYDELRLFGYRIMTDGRLVMQSGNIPEAEFTKGWLEEKILKQFKMSQTIELNDIVYGVLSDILNSNHTYNNPNRTFLARILKHQRMNFCEIEEEDGLFSKKITVKQNRGISLEIQQQITNPISRDPGEQTILIIRKAVRQNICKFRDNS